MGVIEPCPLQPPPSADSIEQPGLNIDYCHPSPSTRQLELVTTVFCLLHQQMDRRNKPKYSEEIFRKIVQLRGSGVK